MTQGIIAEIQRLFPEEKGKVIAIVGAGGKTSLMRYLATKLPGTVVCTTSTKLLAGESNFFDQHLIWEKGELLIPELSAEWKSVLITNVAIETSSGMKLEGLTQEQLTILKQTCAERQLSLIIEADGAKKRPLKAPEAWEPPIPEFTDLVIYVLGLEGLLTPLSEKTVFRSQLFAKLTGLEIGEPVDLNAVLDYLKHSSGGQKGIPAGAKQIVVFNLSGVSQPDLVDHKLISRELKRIYDSIVYARIRYGEVFEIPDTGG